MSSQKKLGNATLPKCDCLNHCGDDPWLSQGKAGHCDYFKAREKTAALVEMIGWKLPGDALPADNVVVLGFFDDLNDGEPVWPCLRFAGKWLVADGMPTEAPKAWAPMPAGPRNTPWMTLRSKP